MIKYVLDFFDKTWTGLIKQGLIKLGVIKHGLIKRGENCIYYLFTFTKEVLFHESLTACQLQSQE